MGEKLFAAGMLLLFVAMFLLFTGALLLAAEKLKQLQKQQKQERPEAKVEIGVGGFIGVLPFGFFTSKKIFWIWLATTIAMFVLLWILTRAR